MHESATMVTAERTVEAPDGGGAAPAVAAAGFALYPPRSASGLDPGQPGHLAARLAAFHEHHRALPARRGRGGLFVVDISELARRFVKRWPQARDKAYQLVEGTLARRLGPHDLYLALPGERFLLLVTDLERPAAERLARRLASEITDRLCGMLPEGAACRLRTLPVDLDKALVGVRAMAAVEALVAATSTPAEDSPDAALAELEPGFTPILAVRKRLVSIYALAAAVPVTSMSPALAGSSLVTEEQRAALDRWHVAEAAKALVTPGCRSALLVRVAYATIAGMRHRQPLMLACRRLPAAARRRLLVELEGLPATLPQARLRELVGYLRPFTLGIVVRLEPGRLAVSAAGPRSVAQPVLEQLEAAGILGLALDLVAIPPGLEGGPAPLLTGLVAAAERLGLRSFCHIGAEPRLCRAAIVAGVDHVAGEALLPPSRRPGRVVAVGHTSA